MPYRQNPFFTGRDDLLDTLGDALSTDHTAAISQSQAISGLGGIGKTQIAIEYAYRYRDNYDTVLWTQAESQASLTSSYVTIATVLNLAEVESQDVSVIVEAVKRWLTANDRWLLVFDNADQPELIKDFRLIDPKGHIILTSRARVFDMIGITDPIELDKMTSDDATDFLLKRTGQKNMIETEKEAVAQLSAELDYLPLALEQAAAYILRKQCRFAVYLSEYRNRGIKLLESYGVISSEYPKSVATTWAINFEQIEQASVASADLLTLGDSRI